MAIWGLALASPFPADAAGNCTTTTGPTGYTVSVCLTITDANGGTALSGTAHVAATVTTQGMASGTRVQKVMFCRDSTTCKDRSQGYIITDWSWDPDGSGGMVYQFDWDTTLYPDASSTVVRAFAIVNDGTVAAAPQETVSLANGQTSGPPIPNGFQTYQPTKTDGLVVSAVGDGAGGEVFEQNVASMVQSENPDLFLYLGDVYQKGTPEEFNNWYANYGYGALRAITNPTIGNHEYSGDPQAEGYFRYWDNPPHYYSYDAGGWHFVSLDSTSQFAKSVSGLDQDQPSTVRGQTTQYDWLANDLASNAGACTIVYFHHPRWNQGEEGPTTRLDAVWQLMANNHVSIVLNGHDHDYQRFAPLDASGSAAADGCHRVRDRRRRSQHPGRRAQLQPRAQSAGLDQHLGGRDLHALPRPGRLPGGQPQRHRQRQEGRLGLGALSGSRAGHPEPDWTRAERHGVAEQQQPAAGVAVLERRKRQPRYRRLRRGARRDRRGPPRFHRVLLGRQDRGRQHDVQLRRPSLRRLGQHRPVEQADAHHSLPDQRPGAGNPAGRHVCRLVEPEPEGRRDTSARG